MKIKKEKKKRRREEENREKFFFFKQKTAYEMRISDWSSDVCSSDLMASPTISPVRPPIPASTSSKISVGTPSRRARIVLSASITRANSPPEIGRASCRERVCQYL